MGKEARTTLDQKNVLIVEKNHLAAPVSVTLLPLPPHTTKTNLPHLLFIVYFLFYLLHLLGQFLVSYYVLV